MEYLKSVADLGVSSSTMISDDERISNLEEEVKTLKLGIEGYLAKLKFRGIIQYDDEEIQKYFTTPKKHIHAKLTHIRYGKDKELVF
jgi:ATP-dependent exoDNAse (exonuclease V) alpha subunit